MDNIRIQQYSFSCIYIIMQDKYIDKIWTTNENFIEIQNKGFDRFYHQFNRLN